MDSRSHNNQIVLKSTQEIITFEAVLFLILGFLAMAVPFLFTIAVDLTVGIVLVAGGLTQIYRTIRTRRTIDGFWGSLFLGCCAAIAGGFLLFLPYAGMIALTTLIASYFLASAVMKAYWAITSRQGPRGLILISAFLSFILSAIIFSGLPQTATWVLGVLVGVDFTFLSFFLFQLSSRIGKMSEELEKISPER